MPSDAEQNFEAVASKPDAHFVASLTVIYNRVYMGATKAHRNRLSSACHSI